MTSPAASSAAPAPDSIPTGAVRVVVDTEIGKWRERAGVARRAGDFLEEYGCKARVALLERLRLSLLGAATPEGEAYAGHRHAL